jgi:hypothetical protein
MGRLFASVCIVWVLARVRRLFPPERAPMAVVTRGIIAALYEQGPTRVVTLDDGSQWRVRSTIAHRPPRVGAEARVVRLGNFHNLQTEGRTIPVEPV